MQREEEVKVEEERKKTSPGGTDETFSPSHPLPVNTPPWSHCAAAPPSAIVDSWDHLKETWLLLMSMRTKQT